MKQILLFEQPHIGLTPAKTLNKYKTYFIYEFITFETFITTE